MRTQVKSDDRPFFCKIQKAKNRLVCEEIRLKDPQWKKSIKYRQCLKVGKLYNTECLENKKVEKKPVPDDENDAEFDEMNGEPIKKKEKKKI